MSSFSILRMQQSRFLFRPGGGVQLETVYKGFINRFDILVEFSEWKNSLFRRREVFSLMSWQSSSRSNL